MEINRHSKIVPLAAVESSAAVRGDDSGRPAQSSVRPPEGLSVEQLQQALRSMPDVDLEKVAAIKLALQRGEISLDVAQLARAVLAYHRGNDV